MSMATSSLVIAKALRTIFADRNMTQSHIAEATGIHQSQVSRILRGRFARIDGNVKRICKYANIKPGKIGSDPSGNRVLMDALRGVWDGTDEHARLIARILKDIGALSER